MNHSRHLRPGEYVGQCEHITIVRGEEHNCILEAGHDGLHETYRGVLFSDRGEFVSRKDVQ